MEHINSTTTQESKTMTEYHVTLQWFDYDHLGQRTSNFDRCHIDVNATCIKDGLQQAFRKAAKMSLALINGREWEVTGISEL